MYSNWAVIHEITYVLNLALMHRRRPYAHRIFAKFVKSGEDSGISKLVFPGQTDRLMREIPMMIKCHETRSLG